MVPAPPRVQTARTGASARPSGKCRWKAGAVAEWRLRGGERMNARSITGSLVTVLLFLGAQRAAAHQDPPGCGTIGFNFGMAMFRADGVTPISGNQTVSLCETMQYQFSIQYRTGTAD